MKYLELSDLSRLTRRLDHDGPECSVRTRIEAYSCKNIKRDKKLFKQLEHAYIDEVSNSPPIPSFISLDESTAFGPMSDHAARKTFHTLIATLNVAYPDHEFSDVRPTDFHKEDPADVLNSLSTALLTFRGTHAPSTYSAYPRSSPDLFPSSVPTSSSPMEHVKPSPNAPPKVVLGTHPWLYRTIDEAIGVTECEVYSYDPSMFEFDPHANDFDDDEDDIASVGEEDSSEDEEQGMMFEPDPYDVDEAGDGPSQRISANGRISPSSVRTSSSNDVDYRVASPTRIRMRRRGPLLWSCHYFFYNKKLKRILFITVWSRRPRSLGGALEEDMSEETEYVARSERFLGWEGAVGAGARAMGLRASISI